MPASPRDGLPVRAALHPDGLYLAMAAIAPTELRDPLMFQTVKRLGRGESLRLTPRRELGAWREDEGPSGMIFHVGRCGSTLLSQQLKQVDGVTVYSEPLPVNEILTPPLVRSRAELVAALRSLARVFSRHAAGPYVFKLSSWNTLVCDVLAEAFPRTPWLFNWRDPVEVAVPLVAQPPPWLRDDSPTAAAFRALVDPARESRSTEDLIARLYGALCDAVAGLDLRHGRPLAYTDLPAGAWTLAAPHFALAVDEAARRRMAESAAGYAKAPLGAGRPFEPDSAGKRAGASAAVREAVDGHARLRLERLLEAFRSALSESMA